MDTTIVDQVAHKPAQAGEKVKVTSVAHYKNGERVAEPVSIVHVSKVGLDAFCRVSNEYEKKLRAKERSLAKEARHDRKVREERGSRGGNSHQERKDRSHKLRVRSEVSCVPRRVARDRLEIFGAPTAAQIDRELVRGGVEENPGPQFKRRELSCQEKREMARRPLSPEVAEQIRRNVRRPLSKAQFKRMTIACPGDGDVTDLALAGLADLGKDPETPPSSPASPERPASPLASSSAVLPSAPPLPIPLPPAPPAVVMPPPPPPVVPVIPVPPPAVLPPQRDLSQVFADGDLRGDVLLRNRDEDERVAFGLSRFGPGTELVSATIERFSPLGDERRVSQRGVKLTNKSFEVRHLRFQGVLTLWRIVGYLALLALEALIGFRLVLVVYDFGFSSRVIDLCTSLLLSALANTYLTLFCSHQATSRAQTVAIPGIRFALSLAGILHYIPYHNVFFSALAFYFSFRQPLKPGRNFEVHYCPHLVSCLLGEYKRGTASDVMAQTIHQKTMRLATLPIPDRTASWTASDLEHGSEEVAIFLNSRSDFGRALSTPLPGVPDRGVL